MKIEDVYNELNEQDICKSGYAFSRDYLGKNENYLSVLRARNRQPSIEAWLMLNFALQRRKQIFGNSEMEQMREKASKLGTLQAAVSLHIARHCQENIR